MAHTLNAASRQSPNILLSVFFSTASAGFFMLTQRVVGAPIYIVGGAVGDVFRQQASVIYAENGECKVVYLKTFKKLILISFVPFVIFFIIAPDIFSIIFGEKWRIAGEYAQILAPMFFLQFIANPLSNMYLIAQKQKEDLTMQIILFLVILTPFLIFSDAFWAIVLYSIGYSSIYLYVIYVTSKFAYGAK
jgi:O-antigen/teichoic acid export membrane protein